MKPMRLLLGLLAALSLTPCVQAQEPAKPFVHPLFCDNAVLQRDTVFPVWGWTQPGAQVTVQFAGRTAAAKAQADGKWCAKLGPFSAGGPFELVISGPEQAKLTNVMCGDVWICSGQSNMEMGINAIDSPKDVAAANYPGIRLFMVDNAIDTKPRAVLPGKWKVCTPQSAVEGGWNGFSAVGYFFGRYLHETLKVPIGLIDSNWGGTIAEAWTSGDSLRKMPDFAEQVQLLENAKNGEADLAKAMDGWWAKNDPGSDAARSWAAVDADTKAFGTMDLPKTWEDGGWGAWDGIAWFRRDVNLSADWAGKEATLSLGPIDDRDTTYVNGTKVGAGNDWQTPRVYKLPAGLLKAGRNVIAVRVLDTGGGGGIYGQADQMKLSAAGLADGSLAGTWLARRSVSLDKCGSPPAVVGQGNPNYPTLLYNAMIAPLTPYGLRGAVWYQGESNVGRARQYARLMPVLIADWRGKFDNPRMGFYTTQLANFMARQPQPGESGWAELREAQADTAEHVRHSGMAVAIDIGDAGDIHPKNKQDVGKRLALAALARTYGLDIEYSGPQYRAMTVEGNCARLTMAHVRGGLVAKDGPLTGFAIKGEDGRWLWAEAVIDGEQVVVCSPLVAKPVAVRYAWADNPACNLYNRAGLPAVPFRTDTPYSEPPVARPAMRTNTLR
ncbi:MAG: 9-O-acetylesterase [Armatimonadetes bacterium]|nr:9-O-acetylesterase [Armatimonadota bacterium]